MLEYEKKILLSKSEYHTLLQALGKAVPTVIQTNYYYDTDDFSMNKKGITCRIREKNGKYKATIKSHGVDTAECSTEKTKNVQNEFDDSLFSGLGVRLQGHLITERTVIYSTKFCEAVLDKNRYLNCTDYELEIEYLPECDGQGNSLFRNLAEILYPNQQEVEADDFCLRAKTSKSKSERFIERKNTVLAAEQRKEDLYGRN